MIRDHGITEGLEIMDQNEKLVVSSLERILGQFCSKANTEAIAIVIACVFEGLIHE